jgi:hypothetical protein
MRATYYENFPHARSVAHHISPLPPRMIRPSVIHPTITNGDVLRAERHHGHNHGEIVRSGVAAVCAIAAARIQHAGAVPIQPRAMAQAAVRSGTGTKRPARIAASGIHHASKLVRLLPSQSREVPVVGLLMAD